MSMSLVHEDTNTVLSRRARGNLRVGIGINAQIQQSADLASVPALARPRRREDRDTDAAPCIPR